MSEIKPDNVVRNQISRLKKRVRELEKNAEQNKFVRPILDKMKTQCVRSPKIYAIYGPSGSGKSSLVKEMIKFYKKNFDVKFSYVTGYTTRDPRPGEVEGEDYYFVDHQFFEENWSEMIEVSSYAGNLYSTMSRDVNNLLERGINIFTVLDRNGIVSWKRQYGNDLVTIHITSDKDTLKSRMLGRGDSLEKVEKRLSTYDLEKKRVIKSHDMTLPADIFIYNSYYDDLEHIVYYCFHDMIPYLFR